MGTRSQGGELHRSRLLHLSLKFFFTSIQLLTSTASCGSPSLPTNGYIIPYTSTLEGATVMYTCWNIYRSGYQSQCEEVNVTAVCNKQGYWEPSTEDICGEPTGYYYDHDL